MASKLDGPTPASPAKQRRSPKKAKKKVTQKDTESSEEPATAAAMGCSPSQSIIVESSKNNNAYLHPTIFMVGEKSFQILRELGELKFYHLAQYNEAEDTAESLHRDFAAHLENPIQYVAEQNTKITATSCEMKKSSGHQGTIETDCTIHAQHTEIRRKENISLTEHENRFKDLSPSFPTHSNDIPRSCLPAPEEIKADDLRKVDTTSKSRRNSDPLDEILSAPGKEDSNVEIKTRTKAIFGRNRVLPKIDVKDKDLGHNNELTQSNIDDT